MGTKQCVTRSIGYGYSYKQRNKSDTDNKQLWKHEYKMQLYTCE